MLLLVVFPGGQGAFPTCMLKLVGCNGLMQKKRNALETAGKLKRVQLWQFRHLLQLMLHDMINIDINI